jgi:GTPase
MLFATLDPTARVVKLKPGLDVILSDTVGFISDLPTTLIAAFRATLEDVLVADIILHVRDMAHEDAEAQGEDVRMILTELGINPDDNRRLIEVWNKADLLTPERRKQLDNVVSGRPGETRPFLVSAVTGDGLDGLLGAIESRLTMDRKTWRLKIQAADGEGLSAVYGFGEVLARKADRKGDVTLHVRLSAAKAAQMLRRFPNAQQIP